MLYHPITPYIQIATFIVATFTFTMLYRQHRYRMLLDLHKELLEPEMQASLRRVFALEAERMAKPTEGELVDIERVLNMYDLLALRAKQGAISLNGLLASEWRLVLPLWEKTEPFLRRQRELRHCPEYKEYFEWLVREAGLYRDRHYANRQPKPFHKAELVREEGCSMVFVNAQKKVLLYQRDENPAIREPGKWDLFGGKVEAGERPSEAIVREVQEEIGLKDTSEPLSLKVYRHFKSMPIQDRVEHVYWTRLDKPAEELEIYEGANPRWFSQSELENLDIAFGFKDVLKDFFRLSAFRA